MSFAFAENERERKYGGESTEIQGSIQTNTRSKKNVSQEKRQNTRRSKMEASKKTEVEHGGSFVAYVMFRADLQYELAQQGQDGWPSCVSNFYNPISTERICAGSAFVFFQPSQLANRAFLLLLQENFISRRLPSCALTYFWALIGQAITSPSFCSLILFIH